MEKDPDKFNVLRKVNSNPNISERVSKSVEFKSRKSKLLFEVTKEQRFS